MGGSKRKVKHEHLLISYPQYGIYYPLKKRTHYYTLKRLLFEINFPRKYVLNEICKELEQGMRKITNGCEIPTEQKQQGGTREK